VSEAPQAHAIQTEEQLAAHISRPFDEVAIARLQTPLTPNDVVISTFPKCGTTWSAQIAHGLRSNGDMSFENIGRVFPWFEMGHFFGQELDSTRRFTPALFKSHMALSELPTGGKVINIIRNPGDTLMSYYNFWADMLFDRSDITLDMMARQFFLLEKPDHPQNMFRLNYFQHLVDFHTADYDGPVLFIAYEDMKNDLPAAVRRIASFMDLDLSLDLGKELEEKVTHQATFEFMSEHRQKFTEQVPNGFMEMVVTGRVGDAQAGLSEQLKAQLKDAWQEYVTPHLGYASYDDLRAAISLT
jgi:hypothetical protein